MISEKKRPIFFHNSKQYQWSILDTEPQTDLFSYTFGEDALKSFIIHDNEKVIEKILFGTKQLTRTDNKTMLVNVKFSLNACKNLSKSELDNLRDTARDFFYLVQSFGNKLKLGSFVNLWVAEDCIPDLTTVTCGIFQIYFQDNLFNTNKNSKIQKKTKLNKKTIELLLNELFVLDDQEQNENIIKEKAKEQNITVT